MANHGKTGAELEQYRTKRYTAGRVISGIYNTPGSDKRVAMSLNKFKREKNRRGKEQHHYQRARSQGR